MKRNKIVTAALALLLTACATQKKVAYEFPPEMKEEVRVQYVQLVVKGKILYDINCSRCHNIRIRGKEVIPDFAPEKLVGYELRVKNGQHEAAMPDTKVPAEELALISIFLTYKKKNRLKS